MISDTFINFPLLTFSNTVERGEYNSDAKAILTLSELEKWLTLVIVGQYHNNGGSQDTCVNRTF